MNYSNILIVADLEGIVGLDKHFSILNARRMMIRELQCIVKIIKNYNSSCLINICNVHNDGNLLDTGFFTNRVNYIDGILKLLQGEWYYDCALLVGFHAMTGNGGLFDHTFRSDFVKMHFEGCIEPIGEVATLITWLESKGIPVILVSAEGNVDCELINRNIILHKVDNSKNSEIQLDTLCRNIESALSVYAQNVVVKDNRAICIQLDNSDF